MSIYKDIPAVGNGTFFVLNTSSGTFQKMDVCKKRVNVSDVAYDNKGKDIVVFCECRNLNNTPPQLQGLLSAYTLNKQTWNLGIVLYMTMASALIAQFNGNAFTLYQKNHKKSKVNAFKEVFNTVIELSCDDIHKSSFKQFYLNKVHGSCFKEFCLFNCKEITTCPQDGYWQCALEPDVINLKFNEWSNHWKNAISKNRDSSITVYPDSIQMDNEQMCNRKKQKSSYSKVTLTLNDQKVLLHDLGKDCFYVPYIQKNGIKSGSGHIYQRFAAMNTDGIKKLQCKQRRFIEDHNKFLDDHNQFITEMPVFDTTQSNQSVIFVVKLQDSTDYIQTSQVDVTEVCDLEDMDSDEILLSRWDNSTLPEYDDWNIILKSVLDVYGNIGFGDRQICKTVGLNVYSGLRSNGRRVHPSPITGPSLLTSSQYFRETWDMTLMPVIQKVVNNLTKHAADHGVKCDRKMNNLLFALNTGYRSRMRRHCRVSIITCGSNKSIGFGCTNHVDKQDKCSQELQEKVHEVTLSTKKTRNFKTVMELIGVGVPTTCGYKLIVDKEMDVGEKYVVAYFIMSGFGCCVRIHSELYHFFYGYTFSHSTAIPVVVDGDEVLYYDAGVNVFAWGAAGS